MMLQISTEALPTRSIGRDKTIKRDAFSEDGSRCAGWGYGL